MPHTSEVPFTIRYDECDAYGHLNNAVYLRYMQEAAIRASSESGLAREQYTAMRRHWLIRETEIEYLHALQAGERLVIRTWNEGMRHATAQRRYEFSRPKVGDSAARAWTQWVFVDSDSGRPAKIPTEVQAAFFPETGRAPGFTRIPFPRIPPAPPGCFKLTRRVEWRDIDPMQHLNNAAYLSYAEDCAVQLADAFGWSFDQWGRHSLAFVARKHHIQYLHPIMLEDELEISTWLFNVRRTSATRYYAMRRAADGELMAQIATLWALIDLENGRPTRFPDSFREIIGPNIAG